MKHSSSVVTGKVGPTHEIIVSRTRYVSAQTENKARIIACGVSLANVRDRVIDAPSQVTFRQAPSIGFIYQIPVPMHRVSVSGTEPAPSTVKHDDDSQVDFLDHSLHPDATVRQRVSN